MDFYTLLDHVVERLRLRVTYRALQRQFDLDEATLHDLTDKLLYAQQVARDEDGRVLVWTGTPAALPASDPMAAPPALLTWRSTTRPQAGDSSNGWAWARNCGGGLSALRGASPTGPGSTSPS
jgi:hypothetical protein